MMPSCHRAALLAACLAAGGAVGFAGTAWTGETAWWLAVPAVLALGWLAVADPTRCAPPPARRRSRSRRGDAP